MELSIVVPCYNEADNLSDLIAAFREAIGARQGVEVIFVNNGSKDKSAAIFAEELSRPQNRFARTVLVSVNQGYGHGILSGLRAAAGPFLAWTHADLQTDPADVLRAFDILCAAPAPTTTLVRGRRIGRPIFDSFFTAGMSAIATLSLGCRLRDVNAQPKVFHRQFFDAIHAEAPKDFSLDLYLLYQASRRNLAILECPVAMHARRHGDAKGGGSLAGKFKLTKRTFAYIIQMRRQLKQSKAA